MKKVISVLLVLLLFSCSKEETETIYIEVPAEVPEIITGTLRYEVTSSLDKLYISFIDETLNEKKIYLEKEKTWEYSFEAKQGDLVYVIVQNFQEYSTADIRIYFNDNEIGSVGCSSNTEMNCWSITKIP